MKSIIRKLFSYHEFDLLELDFGDLYLSRDDRKYYWLIVEENILPNILEQQDEWFEKCKERIDSKEFDKNTSMLILGDKETSKSQKQDVLRIEEDPFQFKKYVLLYTAESLKNLNEQSNNGEAKEILDLIINEDVFKSYKFNYADYNWRNLLYNIAHKLPFLDINVKVDENLENLFVQSYESLTNLNLIEYSEFIESKFNEDKMVEISNLDLDELIELLVNDVEDGN